jgi:hypothetical protein
MSTPCAERRAKDTKLLLRPRQCVTLPPLTIERVMMRTCMAAADHRIDRHGWCQLPCGLMLAAIIGLFSLTSSIIHSHASSGHATYAGMIWKIVWPS